MPSKALKQSLLTLPRAIKRFLVIALDVLICAFSVWLAFGLRLDYWGFFQDEQWLTLAGAVALSFPLFVFFGLYRAIFRFVGSVALASIARVFLMYTTLFFCAYTLYGVEGVPRSIGVIQPILLFIGVGTSRYFVRFWLGDIGGIKKSFHRKQPVALIYGAGSAGRQLVAGLSNAKELIVKGFIDDDTSLHGNTINGVPVYPSINLQDLIGRFGVTDVLLAIPSASQKRRRQIINSLNGCGVRVRTLPGLFDIASGRVRASDLHDLDMNDLLGREVVPPKVELLEKNIRNKTVLVTGAGGSIGSELCRQIIKFSPASLIMLDSSEHSLYLIYEEIKKVLIEQKSNPQENIGDEPAKLVNLIPCLISVQDPDSLLKIFKVYRPETVFHAAAYKHVPLVEQNPGEGIRNNVLGTICCAKASIECSASNFILVSTDKAVRPTNVMGASKRIAELVIQALADNGRKGEHSTNFSIVRFGNVLGSSGSVAPLFSAQISAGGPITLTHLEVTRYFMTIPEAAQLVIQAGAMAIGGDVFVLNMGEPVRIYDLAVRMVYLSGLLIRDEENLNGDIEIKVTGLRPGEKLYEELLIGDNPEITEHPKIMKAHEEFLKWVDLERELEMLRLAVDSYDVKLIRETLKKLAPGYQPNTEPVDWYGEGN